MSENVLTSIFTQQLGPNAVPDLIGETANHPVQKTWQGIYEYMGKSYKPYEAHDYQPIERTTVIHNPNQATTNTTTTTTQRVDPVEIQRTEVVRPVVQRSEVSRTVVRETPIRTLAPSPYVPPSPAQTLPYTYRETPTVPKPYVSEPIPQPERLYKYYETPQPVIDQSSRTSQVITQNVVQSPRRVVQPTVSSVQSTRSYNYEAPVLQRAYSYHDEAVEINNPVSVRNTAVQQSTTTNRVINQGTYHTTETRTAIPAQSNVTTTQYRTQQYNTSNIPASQSTVTTNYRTVVPPTQSTVTNYRTVETNVQPVVVGQSTVSTNYRTYNNGNSNAANVNYSLSNNNQATSSETRYQTTEVVQPEISTTYREVIRPVNVSTPSVTTTTTTTEVVEQSNGRTTAVKAPQVARYESVKTIRTPPPVKPVVYTETITTHNKDYVTPVVNQVTTTTTTEQKNLTNNSVTKHYEPEVNASTHREVVETVHHLPAPVVKPVVSSNYGVQTNKFLRNNYVHRTQYPTRPPRKVAPLINRPPPPPPPIHAPPPPPIHEEPEYIDYTPYITTRRRRRREPLYVPTSHGLQIIDEIPPWPPRPHRGARITYVPPPPTPPLHDGEYYLPETESRAIYYMPPPPPAPPVHKTIYLPGPPKQRGDYYHALRVQEEQVSPPPQPIRYFEPHQYDYATMKKRSTVNTRYQSRDVISESKYRSQPMTSSSTVQRYDVTRESRQQHPAPRGDGGYWEYVYDNKPETEGHKVQTVYPHPRSEDVDRKLGGSGVHLSLYPPTKSFGDVEPVRVYPPTKLARSEDTTDAYKTKNESSSHVTAQSERFPPDDNDVLLKDYWTDTDEIRRANGNINDVSKYYSPQLTRRSKPDNETSGNYGVKTTTYDSRTKLPALNNNNNNNTRSRYSQSNLNKSKRAASESNKPRPWATYF